MAVGRPDLGRGLRAGTRADLMAGRTVVVPDEAFPRMAGGRRAGDGRETKERKNNTNPDMICDLICNNRFIIKYKDAILVPV